MVSKLDFFIDWLADRGEWIEKSMESIPTWIFYVVAIGFTILSIATGFLLLWFFAGIVSLLLFFRMKENKDTIGSFIWLFASGACFFAVIVLIVFP